MGTHTMCLDAHSPSSRLAAGHQGHQLPLPHLPLHSAPLTALPHPSSTVLGDWEQLQRLTPSAEPRAKASLVRHIHPSVLICPLCPLPLARPAAWLSHVPVVTTLLSPARHQPVMEHHQGWLLV